MFGVDEQGRDTLSPQFSRGGKRGPEKIKPGSDADLMMSADSHYRALSKDPQLVELTRLSILSEMLEQGKIQLTEDDLTRAQQELVEGSMQAWDERQDHHKESLRVIASQHSPTIDSENIHSQDLLDTAYRDYERKRVHKQRQEKYSKKSPDVVRHALRNAAREGRFSDLKLEPLVEERLRKRALNMAERLAKQQRIHASRAAIINLNL